MDDDNEPKSFEDTWTFLKNGIDNVFKQQSFVPKVYMSLYQSVYNYITSVSIKDANRKLGGMELYRAVENYLTLYTKDVFKRMKELVGEDLLKSYTTEWELFLFSVKVIDGIFGYLNRDCIIRERDEGKLDIYMIYRLAMVIWKREMFDNQDKKIIDAVLELIRLERSGTPINRSFVSSVTETLVQLGAEDADPKRQIVTTPKGFPVYKEVFEDKFIAATREFYTAEIQKFHEENDSVTDYMIKVETRLQQEKDRLQLCLHYSTGSLLSACCEDVMITRQLEFIQAHFGRLLEQKMDEHLTRMYGLCSRVKEGLDALRKALQDYVTNEGQEAIQRVATEASNDPKLYMKTLLDVHERYQGLVDRSFRKDPGFLKSLDSAAITFVNKNAVTTRCNPAQAPLKSAELMSRYCDQLFKKSSKMPDEMEMEVLQKQVITLFNYLDDKDVFHKFYAKMFSRRLITDSCASDEAETSFIAKLTDSCGFEYTSRLTKMFQDVQVSKDLTSECKEKFSDGKKSIEFNALVLSSGTWPSFPMTKLTLPQQLSTSVENFNKYYQEKFNGRRLSWVYSQCRGEVTCSAFKGKKYVFGVTTPQMCTLLLFNEQTVYVAEKIMEATGMDTRTTAAIVGSLVKNLVLKSDLDLIGEDVPLTATITLNEQYTNKKVRVDLSKIAMKTEAVKETETVQKSLEQDRRNMIDACIVRVMKARKQCQHQQLTSEVISQLSARFKPKVEMIKRCIGGLIEKDYMKRVDGQRDVYDYVA